MTLPPLPKFRQFLIGAAAVSVIASRAAEAQAPADCQRRDVNAIAARERAAAEWPKALLPQIELAVCYDQAWRFQDVEPAIEKAVAILDAEIAAAPPAAASAGARPLAGADVPVPRRTRDAQADYPIRALVAGITGSVIIELVIDPKGNVREARAVKAVPELEEAALKAARKWKYEPTLVGGKATEVLSYASIRFGQTAEPMPSDWLAMAALHFEQRLLTLARGTLDAAIAKSRDDRKRFAGYLPGRSAGPVGRVTGPVKTKDVKPNYPEGALSSRTEGTVIIEALIDTSGAIGRAHVLSKPSVLDAAALNAVLKWEFTPATRNGAPMAIAMTSTVSFTLHSRHWSGFDIGVDPTHRLAWPRRGRQDVAPTPRPHHRARAPRTTWTGESA